MAMAWGDVDSSTGSNDGVAETVAAIAARSVCGEVTTSELQRVLLDRSTPARDYRAVRAGLTARGILVVEQLTALAADPAADARSNSSAAPETHTREPAVDIRSPETGRSVGGDPGWDVDGWDHFVKTRWHDVLSPEEEHALTVRAQRGRLAREALTTFGDTLDFAERRRFQRQVRDGNEAETALIHANLRLVLKLVKRHRKDFGPALDEADLFQEGVIGLGHAITKFDPDRGFKLSTYATWWIRQAITRAIADKKRVIRLPVHKYEQVRKVVSTAAAMSQSGDQVSPGAIARRLEMSESTVRECLALNVPARSLDHVLTDGGDSLMALLADPGADPADVALARAEGAELACALGSLNERERQVIALRFGIADGQERTLEEVGREFGVTRERIRQIESKALNKLRANQDIKAMRLIGPTVATRRGYASATSPPSSAHQQTTSHSDSDPIHRGAERPDVIGGPPGALPNRVRSGEADQIGRTGQVSGV